MATLTPAMPRIPGLSITGGGVPKPVAPDVSKLFSTYGSPTPQVNPTLAAGIAANLKLSPGSRGPGGVFEPASMITPDTQYIPTNKYEASGVNPAYMPGYKPAIPQIAAPTVQPTKTPLSPAPAPSRNALAGSNAIFTTPSGAKVNQFTGELISGPDGSSGGTPAPSASPAIPAMPAPVGGPGSGSPGSLDPSVNPFTSSTERSAALRALSDSSRMSPEEQTATQNLSDLNASFSRSYASTAGQPIPLQFITGQQAQLQREKSAMASPLESEIAFRQAQRGAAFTGAQAQLGAANNQLSTIASLNTKTPIPFGSSLYTPATGATTGGGVFGGSSGAAPTGGTPFDANNQIDQMVQTYMNTGSIPSNIATNYPQYVAAITQRANDLSMQQTGQPFNPSARSAGVSADTASLGNLQKQFDQSNSSFQTIKANGKLLLEGLTKAGLNATNIPLANAVQQAIAKGLVNPGEQAAFTNSLNTLQSEYAKMLMGTGVPTDQATARATEALPTNLNASQLATVLDRIIGEGTNSIGGLKTNIDSINKRLNPYDFSAKRSVFGTGGGGSKYDF